jgi:hypothetical protein
VALLSGSFAPDLAKVVLAWPALSATTRQTILALAGQCADAEPVRAHPTPGTRQGADE